MSDPRYNLRPLAAPPAVRTGAPSALSALSEPFALSWAKTPPAAGVGKIECPDGSPVPCTPTVSARIFVGLTRGVRARHCAGAPKKYKVEDVDRFILGLRVHDVGRDNAGATRYTAAGVFEGKGEKTAVYELFPAAGETPEMFTARTRKMAEETGQAFCQKAVYVEHGDGKGGKVTESAVFEGPKARKGRKP